MKQALDWAALSMLWFVRQQRKQQEDELGDVEIIFATPVYGLNVELTALYGKSKLAQIQLDTKKAEQRKLRDSFDEAWQKKNLAGYTGKAFLSLSGGHWCEDEGLEF